MNAGLAFDEAQALDLRSIDRIRTRLGEDALNPAAARPKIFALNAYLEEQLAWSRQFAVGDGKLRQAVKQPERLIVRDVLLALSR